MGFYSDGKEKEREFASHFDNVKFANKNADMHEHWDLMIDGFKYDVKGIKKVRRIDLETNEFYHQVEIYNGDGKTGWVNGEADFFAFETKNYWVVVGKLKLQELVRTKIAKSVWVENPDECLYCNYQRKGKKDRITLVKTIDLMAIADRIITKTTGIIEDEIGETVIPDKIEIERLRDELFKYKMMFDRKV